MSFTQRFVTLAGLAIAGAALMLAGSAFAAPDVAKEVATAAQHAELASKAPDLDKVHMHLHHVINCMVGPKGKTYDDKPGNPCKDLGNGVMPDTKGMDKAKRAEYQKALNVARRGVKATKVETAQKDAAAASAILKKASM